MYQIDFENPLHLHFIGIGGISMSGLAEILMQQGFTISGSDSTASALTEHLKKLGAKVAIGQKAENITPGIQAVVYTAAIREDNPEYQECIRKNLPMISRADLLGQIMKNYSVPIAVAGTHGKTTTTSMASCILMQGGCDPTISLGGILPLIKGNIRVGHSDYFIAEACEYTNSFHAFRPKIAVITNVDEDHLDFFSDLDEIAESFHTFADLLPASGTLIINRDTKMFDEVTRDLRCSILTYSLTNPNADFVAEDILYDERGCASFCCVKDGAHYGIFSIQVPGLHNIENALASIALADVIGIDKDSIRTGLTHFAGTERRFEYKGTFNDITVIDDYAHHPAEIEATFHAAENIPHKEVYLVFQPHTYTRTSALFDDFRDVLSRFDHVILADIYAAREVNTIGISSGDLCNALAEKGCDAIHLKSFGEITTHLKSQAKSGDLIITMGAGDVWQIAEALLQ